MTKPQQPECVNEYIDQLWDAVYDREQHGNLLRECRDYVKNDNLLERIAKEIDVQS